MVGSWVLRRTSAIVFMLLVAAAALSGCLGSEDVELTDDPEAPTDIEGETGTVAGQVVNARDFSPVQAAQVSIVKDNEAVATEETDSDGRFEIRGLKPDVYRVQVNAIGFYGDVAPAHVTAGETVTTNLVLEAMPSERPWSEPLIFEGLMGLGYHGVGPVVTCCSADPNHRISFSFEVRPDLLRTMTFEMVWPEEHVGLRANIWLNPDCDPACDPDHDYTVHSDDDNLGWGGLEMRIDRPDGGWPQISGDEDVELWIYVWADSGDEAATLAYQQQFQIYMENFYVDPAPEGHSPRGDH